LEENVMQGDGKEIGTRTTNPILDTREYKVVFLDGSTNVFTANVIADSLFSQVDDEGRSQVLMDAIINHKSDGSALSKDDKFEVTESGQQCPRRHTTNEWFLMVTWKDGSLDWVHFLKELKESYPVETAADKIVAEPAFDWCGGPARF
jgi:hypothetical protein